MSIYIYAIFNPSSTKEKVAFLTEPPISDEIFSPFEQFCKESPELTPYMFDHKEGLLIVSSAEKGEMISISSDIRDIIQGNLSHAGDEVAETLKQLENDQRKRKEILEDVATVFKVPILEERPRRLDPDL